MKLTGLDVFDSTVEQTTLWLQDLMRELNWTDRRRSYVALRNVLHGVRDYLPTDRAIEFGNQLPMLIRGVYFENWNPALKLAAAPQFASESEIVVRAVFRVLERKASEGEIQDIRGILPPDLLQFWPQTLRAA
jgi:uncharacterized protein (DUF2267 family)